MCYSSECLQETDLRSGLSRSGVFNTPLQSIRLGQAFFGPYVRVVLSNALAISIKFRMTWAMAILAGFPVARRWCIFL
jgi:hypothetical protein